MPREVETHLRAMRKVLLSLLERSTVIGDYLAASVIDRVGGGFP